MAAKHEKDPRITLPSMHMLAAFADNQYAELSGSSIAKATGMASGTLYPLLMRFEQAKWLESRWEDVDPVELGRPRRRLYRLTPTGLAKVLAILQPFARGEPA
jgi:DNA-binding PadR family transcriptional regulator